MHPLTQSFTWKHIFLLSTPIILCKWKWQRQLSLLCCRNSVSVRLRWLLCWCLPPIGTVRQSARWQCTMLVGEWSKYLETPPALSPRWTLYTRTFPARDEGPCLVVSVVYTWYRLRTHVRVALWGSNLHQFFVSLELCGTVRICSSYTAHCVLRWTLRIMQVGACCRSFSLSIKKIWSLDIFSRSWFYSSVVSHVIVVAYLLSAATLVLNDYQDFRGLRFCFVSLCSKITCYHLIQRHKCEYNILYTYISLGRNDLTTQACV